MTTSSLQHVSDETSKAHTGACAEVEDLLNTLSLEEKLGQLVGYWFDRRGPGEVVAPMQDTLGAGRPPFEEAAKHGLGHFTRVIGTEPAPVDELIRRLRDKQKALIATSRAGIPAIAHEECLTGVNAVGATVYPAPLSWGATFDPSIAGKIGTAIGADLRALGVHQGLSPVLDVIRDYRWGRVEECISEDPILVGTIGAAYAKGIEDEGIIATLKHFVGYSASRSGRNHAPVSAGPREVADVLLIPFEIAIRDARVRSVMNSYSDIDGVPVALDEELFEQKLRSEWGFTGTAVSDYWAIPFLATAHGVAKDATDAGRLALEAGIDVELPNGMCYPPLAELVRNGELSEETVDTAVRRVLTQKHELGLLNKPDFDSDVKLPNLDSKENRKIARAAAEASVVLLRNEGMLPISPDFAGKIAVVGPAADNPRALLGCYSYPVHVLPRFPEFGLGLEVKSIFEAISQEFPDAQISHVPGADFFNKSEELIADAIAVCEDADLVIAAVGDLPGMFGRGTSGEGCDAADLQLPGDQSALLSALAELSVPKILITNSGRPYAFDFSDEQFPAALQTFIPGAEGASAIAGVISGRVNPSGKLPVQIPKVAGGSQHLYLGAPLTRTIDKISNQSTEPAFPFGHGLSYTQFEIDAVHFSKDKLAANERATISCDIQNVGERSGAEVLQLYLRDPLASLAQPIQKLVGFARVELAAGNKARVTFEISPELSSYSNKEFRRVVDTGELIFSLGVSSQDNSTQMRIDVTSALDDLGPDRMMWAPVTVSNKID